MVSARCFKSILLFLLILLIFSERPCHAINITGVPKWLEPAVLRSLNAVWNEIPDLPEIDREGTLKIVASRLFSGYDISVISLKKDILVSFEVQGEILRPEINLNLPELRGMALSWFENDIEGMDEKIFFLVDKLPQAAFTWSDEAFREKLSEIVKEHLPGWEFSLQIFISNESTLINISFRPGTPLVLAIQPSLYSRTVPAMFRSDLEAKLIPEFSPLIGIPVNWAFCHKKEIENKAEEFLEERHSVENMKADVKVNFTPGAVSNLEAMVDSENFLFQVWVAAYAGLDERYPEAGTFFGFRPEIIFNPEIYAELIFELEDFDLTRRVGARFEIFNNFWAGIEIQWPDNKYFLRFQYSPLKIRRPYVWCRWSPEIDSYEGALGYKIDEHVSVEIYYDGIGSDKFGLRGLWFL